MGVFKFLFDLICIPGYVLVWIKYFFPSGGIIGVAESGRQMSKKRTFAFIYSVAIYFCLIVYFYYGI